MCGAEELGEQDLAALGLFREPWRCVLRNTSQREENLPVTEGLGFKNTKIFSSFRCLCLCTLACEMIYSGINYNTYLRK